MASDSNPLLQSIQIIITGFYDHEKAELQSLAKAQGAVILSSANANDPPHVIITRAVGSPRYSTILRRNPRTPVVTPEWLTSSIQQGIRLPYSDFALGIFGGLTICFSGLPIADKKELAKAVTSNGGLHSSSLDKKCSFVVTESTESDKYLFAQVHRIPCVVPEWITACVAAGYCIDHLPYLTNKKASQQQLQHQGAQLTRQVSLAKQREDSPALLLGGRNGSSLLDDQCTNNSGGLKEQSGRSNSEETLSKLPLPRAGDGEQLRRTTSRLGRVTNAAGEGLGDPDAIVPATAVHTATPWTTLECDDHSNVFLETCYVWVIGCSPAEELETLELCAKGGAKRFIGNEPHDRLTTHIVGGSAPLSGSLAETAIRYIDDNPQVAAVGLEWLRRSVARGEALPADERFTVSIPSLSKTNKSPRANSTAAAAAAHDDDDGGVGDGSQFNSNGVNASLLKQPSGVSLITGGLLDNCYFTLAAVRGTPEGGAAERLIRSHGGRIFSSSVPSSCKGVFAICPYSLPSHKALSLKNTHPDFAAVPESQRFTLYWLECSLQAGELLKPQHGTPCFQPLPHRLPLPGMDKLSISMSGFPPDVRTAIQRTVEIVGGRVSVDCMTTKDTHLICQAAVGKKYYNAARFGVIPVTADWLVNSVHAGKVLKPDNYAPLLPTGGGGAAAAVGPSATQKTTAVTTTQAAGAAQLPGAGPGVTSFYAAAMAGPLPASQKQPAGASGAGPSKPSLPITNPAAGANGSQRSGAPRASLRERANRMKTAAQKSALPTAAAPPPRPQATAFDLESLLAPPAAAKPAAAIEDAATNAIASVLGRSASVLSPKDSAPPVLSPQPPRKPATAASPPKNDKSANPPISITTTTTATKPVVSETQDDGGRLASAMDQVSSLLGRIPSRPPGGGPGSHPCSQQDMPPPPARNFRDGSRLRGKRRRAAADEVPVEPARRSSRRAAGVGLDSESDPLDMSQQVGYESIPVEIELQAVAVSGKASAAANAAKERLTRAAARQRRGLGVKPDILEGF